MKKFLALSLSGGVFFMLIYVKMPTIVGILTFVSRINFVLSCVKHGKSFITSEPVWDLQGVVLRRNFLESVQKRTAKFVTL